jgi:hypothetical protein
MEPVTYWNKETETLPREKLEELQLQRFREQMQYMYDRSPMYRRKYDAAGIKPADIRKSGPTSTLGGFSLHSARRGGQGVPNHRYHRYPRKGHDE